MHRLMERQTESNILFLDACRDNPLARNLARSMGTRSAEIGRGLAQIQAGVGTLISFATQPGNVALDGAGRNSPFTGALVKHLAEPKEDLSGILIDVRKDVMRATKNKQIPWEHVALRDRFYFAPPKGSDPAGLTPGQTARAASSEAASAWALVKDGGDLRTLEAFRRQYGAANRFYDRLAEARIEQLKGAAETAKRTAEADAQAKERERLALLQRQQEEEGKRAEEKRKADEAAARRDPALSVKPGSGQSFRDCDVCPEMVVVPAGSFTMGSSPEEIAKLKQEYSSDWFKNEGPQRTVRFARPFAVGKFEVTFAEWDACVNEGGCSHRPEDLGWGRGIRPVINVSWNEIAKQYLPWLSRKTGKTYRLLTEAEWEYAARAGTTTRYSFGNTISTSQARYIGEKTVDVGSFQPNGFGLYDMHGNVWEWVQDCWNDGYKGAPSGGPAWTTGDCGRRVLRGGSWVDDPRYLRSASRYWYTPGYRIDGRGLRVGRTLTP